MINILDIVGGKVVINVNCLSIPELKAITETFPDCKLNALTYVHYVTHPDSPYLNMDRDKVSPTVYRDFPGTYTPDSSVVVDAIEKLKELMVTPEDRLFEGAKQAAENLSAYLLNETADIGDPKEALALTNILKNVQNVSESLGAARESRDKARTMKARGQGKIAYDQ